LLELADSHVQLAQRVRPCLVTGAQAQVNARVRGMHVEFADFDVSLARVRVHAAHFTHDLRVRIAQLAAFRE
jgi:hypothetical protein